MGNKAEIINRCERGESYRRIAKETGIHRKTIARYHKQHLTLLAELAHSNDVDTKRQIQAQITETPQYIRKHSVRKKYTEEIDTFIDNLLTKEKHKDDRLGPRHKQKLTNTKIHALLKQAGFDIGISTVRNAVNEKREILKETYIRQTYHYGDRLEFDYGEVWLVMNNVKQKYYLAVRSSPASNLRMAYLYDNAGKRTFLDAHVRFFEYTGGVYHEVVYDNMRNVVSKFIGKTEKKLNEDLLSLALYYGFEINVTNCYSGNEKGHVEGSVRYIRNNCFAHAYAFESFEAEQLHLANELERINERSQFDIEKEHLLPTKPPLDTAEVTKTKVSKYAIVRVENNFYSVPENLNGKDVIIKNYLYDIEIYYKQTLVAKHKKIEGYLEYQLDIYHYTKTLKTKPGAIAHSQALMQNQDLKTIYDTYYSKKPKLFIELLEQHKDNDSATLNHILTTSHSAQAQTKNVDEAIVIAARKQIASYNTLLGGTQHVKH